MQDLDVIKQMVEPLRMKRLQLEAALDRGGQGKQIENWMLTEMNAELIDMRNKRLLLTAEGEHKYPATETGRCDLWWKGDHETWLEVKTFVLLNKGTKGSRSALKKDLSKLATLSVKNTVYSLCILIMSPGSKRLETWKKLIAETAKNSGFRPVDYADPNIIQEGFEIMLFERNKTNEDS